jgi:hypothetical protein
MRQPFSKAAKAMDESVSHFIKPLFSNVSEKAHET